MISTLIQVGLGLGILALATLVCVLTQTDYLEGYAAIIAALCPPCAAYGAGMLRD